MEIGIGCLIILILLFALFVCAMDVFFPIFVIIFFLWVIHELFHKNDK